ncbi:MAG: tRNA glutamyl-Q(34) synthetase GluQRS [Verrucomicrobia bacterium]|nr:tRNA glutamyl-Q(34) synthetase GluQRS [Verrucomicrobiota bacterium]
MSETPYRGRLAPSPTGLLHLGHAATFRAAQERARSAAGRIVLRIEDLDRERCRPEFVDSLLDDLRWAGLTWDEGPFWQSERGDVYLAAWRVLAAAGLVYPCRCTRKDLARALSAPHAEDEQAEPIYPGTCRPPEAQPRPETEPGSSNWRFRVPGGEVIEFVDGHHGPQRFVAGVDFGDFLVWRRDSVPSYQLAVVADDAAMGITEVVRGADLLRSTALQILLYRALGAPPPAWHHVPLVLGPDGRRLAKRAGAHSLRELRQLAIVSGSDSVRCSSHDAGQSFSP